MIMSGYIRTTIGFLAFLGMIGCSGGSPIDLILGTGFALTVWLCARPRQKKIQYIGRRCEPNETDHIASPDAHR